MSYVVVILRKNKLIYLLNTKQTEPYMKKFNKGFTLIELLVVIAIIGILSSIVLASLSSARTKGEDAAIKSTLASMRAQAELYYSTNSNYGITATTCGTASSMFASTTATGSLKNLLDGLAARNVTPACQSSATAWAVSSPLKTAGQFYCVDSTGTAKETTADVATTNC